jgi:hypothetical protein
MEIICLGPIKFRALQAALGERQQPNGHWATYHAMKRLEKTGRVVRSEEGAYDYVADSAPKTVEKIDETLLDLMRQVFIDETDALPPDIILKQINHTHPMTVEELARRLVPLVRAGLVRKAGVGMYWAPRPPGWKPPEAPPEMEVA